MKLLFGFIFVFMLAITTWATMEEGVVEGFWHIVQYRWGWATLADTYFAFLTFYVWVFSREKGLARRLGWFVAIMALGNLAMSVYVLRQINSGRTLGPAA